MTLTDVLSVVFRWAHVGSVILLVGGAAFLRLVVMPSAKALTDEQHQLLKEGLLKRWAKFVHPLVGLILISGLYNFVIKMKTSIAVWHALAGIKLLLGLFVLFVASALVGRSKGLQPIRDKAPKWLAINLSVAFVIVLISGVLRYLPNKPGL